MNKKDVSIAVKRWNDDACCGNIDGVKKWGEGGAGRRRRCDAG
ncbi:hypothetical protein [Nitrospira sp. Nam80]